MSIHLNTEDGGVVVLDPTGILCFRQALDSEHPGSLAIKLNDGTTLFAHEAIGSLMDKISHFGTLPLAKLTPPSNPDAVWINAKNVFEVAPANGQYSPNARTVVKFSLSLYQTVRETPEETRAALDEALGDASF